jgi:DNA-directed RNA polymerase omega subunit
LTNNNIGIGGVDSKFRYIILAAKRTRQLQGGSRPLIAAHSKKFTRIAQEEVTSGLVKYDIVEETKPSKKRTSKESKETKGH